MPNQTDIELQMSFRRFRAVQGANSENQAMSAGSCCKIDFYVE